MAATDDYVDVVARERQRFLALDGVGPATAEVLVEQYDTFDRAVRVLLSAPYAYLSSLGKSRTDAIRDALQDAGHEPVCACEHYTEVQNSQARDDVFSYCRSCGEVIQHARRSEAPAVKLDLAIRGPTDGGEL